MLEKLELFQMANALARHGASRQAVIAENIANADTPGYLARDLGSFSEAWASSGIDGLTATRAGHLLAGDTPDETAQRVYRPDAASPNGNNVSLETEMFAAAEAKADHDRALAIYRSTMTILRTSINTKS